MTVPGVSRLNVFNTGGRLKDQPNLTCSSVGILDKHYYK